VFGADATLTNWGLKSQPATLGIVLPTGCSLDEENMRPACRTGPSALPFRWFGGVRETAKKLLTLRGCLARRAWVRLRGCPLLGCDQLVPASPEGRKWCMAQTDGLAVLRHGRWACE
jgi:hypothetical protein